MYLQRQRNEPAFDIHEPSGNVWLKLSWRQTIYYTDHNSTEQQDLQLAAVLYQCQHKRQRRRLSAKLHVLPTLVDIDGNDAELL